MLATLLACNWASRARAADTLLMHGHIYTGNQRVPWAEALLVRGTKIEAVGSDRELGARRRSGTRVIDLRGRTVIPGIVDSHAHVLYGAYALHGLNLSTPKASVTPST